MHLAAQNKRSLLRFRPDPELRDDDFYLDSGATGAEFPVSRLIAVIMVLMTV